MKNSNSSVIVKKEKMPPKKNVEGFAPTEEEIKAIARKMETGYMTQPKTHHVVTFIEMEE